MESKKLEQIRKINKNIVHEDGTIDSFEKQLLDLTQGNYDVRFPMIISEETKNIEYINDLNQEYPLIISVNNIIKIDKKHHLDYSFISTIPNLLKESVLAFDSINYEDNKIIVLDKTVDSKQVTMICRIDKDLSNYDNVLMVNEINSIYDRKNLINYIVKNYENNNKFYKNEKTEQFIKPFCAQLPYDLSFALSTSYGSGSFTKSQVDFDLHYPKRIQKIMKEFFVENECKYTEEQLFDAIETYEETQKWDTKNAVMLTGTSEEEIKNWVYNSKEMKHILDVYGEHPVFYKTDLELDEYKNMFDQETLDIIEDTLFAYEQGIIQYDRKEQCLVHTEGELFQSDFIAWYEGSIDTESLVEEYGNYERENKDLDDLGR